MSLKRNIKWSSVGTISRYLFQTASIVILARLLTPEDFGVVSASMLVVNFLIVIAQLGGCQAIVVSDNDKYNERLFHVSFFCIITSIIFLLMVNLLAESISKLVSSKDISLYIKLSSLLIIPKALSVIFEGVLIRNSDFKYLAFTNIVTYIFLYFTVAVLLSWMDFGAISIIIASLVQGIGFFLFLFFRCIKMYDIKPKMVIDNVKESLSIALSISMTQLVSNVTSQVDNLVVSRYLGLDMLGVYTRAYQLVVVPCNLIGQIINRAYLHYFSSKEASEEKILILRKSLFTNFVLSLSISTIFTVFGQYVVLFLLGDGWEEITIPLSILSMTIFPRMLYKISEPVLYSLGKSKVLALYSMVYFILVCSSAIFLVRYGMLGIAFSVLIGTSCYGFLSFSKVVSEYQMLKKEMILYSVGYFILSFGLFLYV